MNLFWNVGKGASCEPICLTILFQGRPEDENVDLAIVGKGVTYDTGGLNIKTAMMELMYGDKGGACAVLGAFDGCLNQIKDIKKNIVFACALAENAIGPDAFKPSDILTAMNGKTVEIGNTDAEGRLVMADTMTYVQREFKPAKVLYIATLTGTVALALGTTTAGVFSPHDQMVDDLKKAGNESGEPIWHLPLNTEHRNNIKGQFGGDITNHAGIRFGSASQAAAFLEHFIEDNRPWAHLDIAGTGIFKDKEMSGFGAKLLLRYIYKYA